MDLSITTPPATLPLTASDLDAHLRLNTTGEDTLLTAWITAAVDLWERSTGYTLLSTAYQLTLDWWPSHHPGHHAYGSPFFNNGFGYYSYPYAPYVFPGEWQLMPHEPKTLYLPRRPITGVTSIQYLDTNYTWQTLPQVNGTSVRWPNGWTLDDNRIVFPTSLPTLHPTAKPKIKIAFTAGHTGTGGDNPPATALINIKLLVAHWWKNREAFGDKFTDLPMGWDAICQTYRGVRV